MNFENRTAQPAKEGAVDQESFLMSRLQEGLSSLVGDEQDAEKRKAILVDAIRQKDKESALFLSPGNLEKIVDSIRDYQGPDLIAHTVRKVMSVFEDEGRFSDPIKYEIGMAKRRQENRGMIAINGIFNYGKDEDGIAHIHLENPFSQQDAGTMLAVLNGFVNGLERFGSIVAEDQTIQTITAISDLMIDNPVYAGFFEHLGFTRRPKPGKVPSVDMVWAIDRETFLSNVKNIKKIKLELLRSLRQKGG